MTELKIENGELAFGLLPRMPEMTWQRFGTLWVDNARTNIRHLKRGQSIAALRGAKIGSNSNAIVIAAGPSLRRRDPATALLDTTFNGTLIASESAMAYCLRRGLVPDLVVTLDPHAVRIVRWFGDPELTEAMLREDDYFSRQDQDSAFADELRANDEILELLNRHGKDIRIALATSASRAVVDRVTETGMDIYWWNPMLDDPDKPDSITAQLQAENGMPSINAGGNVGTACWMMADVVLGADNVAVTGMDFSYYDDTPYRNTQYYHEAVALVGEDNLDQLYPRIHNPFVDAWYFTDPAYLWYRQAFLEMVADADCTTYNCTEGGILFGPDINMMMLRDFLQRFGA